MSPFDKYRKGPSLLLARLPATEPVKPEPVNSDHQTRTNGWCFCPKCNDAREDMRRYDDEDSDAE